MAAGANPVGQFVGSFRYTIKPVSGGIIFVPHKFIVRLRLGLAIVVCCALVGCQDKAALLRRGDLVGDYVYKSEDPEDKASDHEFDNLRLQADGKYELVQGGSTKPKSEKVGSWHFIGRDSPGLLFSGESAEVDLDNSGYPVTINGNEIRLMIDDDTGVWWIKVK